MESNNYRNTNLFTKKIRAGKRTYFFDVKQTRSSNDYYVVITESRRVSDEKYEKHKVFIYKEDFRKFLDALCETVEHIENGLCESVGNSIEAGSSQM